MFKFVFLIKIAFKQVISYTFKQKIEILIEKKTPFIKCEFLSKPTSSFQPMVMT